MFGQHGDPLAARAYNVVVGSRQAIHALVEELSERDLPRAKLALERIRATGGTTADDGPSAYDKAKAAGFVGCVDGPEDLSTNPVYMADFGK